MKIKRFEANSMADALRAVKKEFGDEAVILSAKTVKKTNRIFSGKRRKQVIVTAAIDHPDSASGASALGPGEFKADLPKEQSAWLIKDNPKDSLSADTAIAPITRTGQKKLKSKFVQLASEIVKPDTAPESKTLFQRLLDQELAETIAGEWAEQVGQLLFTARDTRGNDNERAILAQVIEAVKMTTPSRSGHSDQQRRVVLVGPAGVGKTTVTAQIAAAAVAQGRNVSVLSLDHYRIAGTEALERYARIIGFQFKTMFDIEEIRSSLHHYRNDDLVIVDTPALNANDPSTRDHLREMLAVFDQPEIHLLLHAGLQPHVLQTVLGFCRSIKIQQLIFTHLDWISKYGTLFNIALEAGLPVSYLADSHEIPEGLNSASAERMAGLLLPASKDSPDDLKVTTIQTKQAKSATVRFLANRNSDIFHRPDCRSVQRINNENILRFEHESDAMAQAFKPCRMCCADLFVHKPVRTASYGTISRGR